MRRFSKLVAVLCIVSLLLPSSVLSGCASSATDSSRPGDTPDTAEKKTIVRTTVSLLNSGDLDVFANGQQALDVDGSLVPVRFPGSPEDQSKFSTRLGLERGVTAQQSGAFLVLAAAYIVQRLIDLIVQEIKKQADKYTADYAVSGSGVLVAAQATGANIEGIVVRRDRFTRTGSDTPIYVDNELCVVYRLAAVPRGSSGTGLFDATPIYLRIGKPVAKTSVFGDKVPKLTTTLKLTLETVGLNASKEAYSTTALDYSFVATRLPVGTALVTRDQLNRRSGLFAAAVGGASPTGVNVKVAVTEVDQGYDAKILRAIAGAIDDNKTHIVDVVKEAAK